MSTLELVAVLLGLANIVLLIRRSIWNYPVAIVMVSLYAVIFRDARLYSDALLQLFFLVVNGWGWWLWHRNRRDAGEIVVRTMDARLAALWTLAGVAAWLVWAAAEWRLTDAAFPFVDAGVAVASVIAQVLLAKRYIENWLVWIAVDMVSIALYWLKDLRLTTGLYALFLMLAGWGWLAWRQAATRQDAAA